MAQVRELGVVLALDHHSFIAAGMETVPVTRKFATLGLELRPPLLPVQRIHLFLVGAGVVVDHHVSDRAHVVLVHLLYQRLQLGAVAI